MFRLRTFFIKYWQGILDAVILLLVLIYIADSIEFHLLLTKTTPSGGDMASHFPTASYLRDVLLPKGRLIGWNPGNYCGFPMFQFYFPLPFFLMVGLSLIIPLEISFKLVSVLGIFLLPVVSYFALRLMKQEFPGPAMAAMFSLPFLFSEGNSMWGGNILSNFAGEFNYQIAFALSLLFVASIFKSMNDFRHVRLNGLLLALIGLTHGVGLLFVVTAGLFFLIQPQGIGKRILYLAKVYALGAGFMAFWLFPFLAGAKWSTKFNLLWHLSGFREVIPIILWPYIAIAAAGTLIALVSRKFQKFSRGQGSPELLAQLGYLWFAIGVGAILYETAYELNVVDIRFLPYVEFLPMLAAAMVLGSVARRLRGTALFLLIVSLATGIWVTRHTRSVSSWAKWNYSGFEGKAAWSTFKAINDFLEGDESDPRVVYEHSPKYDKFGTVRAFENLPYFSGRSTIEGLYMQSSITSPFAFYLQSEISSPGSCPLPQYDYTSLNIEKAVKDFLLFNISHFIAISDRVKNEAHAHSNLERVAMFDDVEIFRVKSSTNGYVEPLKFKPVVTNIDNWRYKSYGWFRSVTLEKPYILFVEKGKKQDNPIVGLPVVSSLEDLPILRLSGETPAVQSNLENDRINIYTDKPGWPLLVKVSYHPNWHCDGAWGPYLASPSFMVIFPTQEKVVMYFSRSSAEWLGGALTLITIILCIVKRNPVNWLLRRNWRIPFFKLKHRQRTLIVILCWLVGILCFSMFAFSMRGKSPERLKQRAQYAYSRGDLEEAFEHYNRLLKLAEESGYGDDANYFQAVILFRQRKYAEALTSFQHLVSKYPDSIFAPEALYHMGLCEAALGNYKAAREAWDVVQKKFPGVKWARFAAKRQGEVSSGESVYEKAMRLFDQGGLRDAANLFAEIRESAPDLATRRNAAYFEAVSFYKMRDWKTCLEKFMRLVEEDRESPWVPEACYHIGMCQKELGNIELAKAVFQHLINKYGETRWAKLARERLNELR